MSVRPEFNIDSQLNTDNIARDGINWTIVHLDVDFSNIENQHPTFIKLFVANVMCTVTRSMEIFRKKTMQIQSRILSDTYTENGNIREVKCNEIRQKIFDEVSRRIPIQQNITANMFNQVAATNSDEYSTYLIMEKFMRLNTIRPCNIIEPNPERKVKCGFLC